jgi:hypothetical protein
MDIPVTPKQPLKRKDDLDLVRERLKSHAENERMRVLMTLSTGTSPEVTSGIRNRNRVRNESLSSGLRNAKSESIVEENEKKSENEKTWPCTVCTFQNNSALKNCEVCQAHRIDKSVDEIYEEFKRSDKSFEKVDSSFVNFCDPFQTIPANSDFDEFSKLSQNNNALFEFDAFNEVNEDKGFDDDSSNDNYTPRN